MAKNYTYEQIAQNFELWGEYVDPHAEMTEEEFNELSIKEKVEMQAEMFGPDETSEE